MHTAPQAIAAALRGQGLATQQSQADTIGIRREHWCKYLAGKMQPGVDLLQRWVASADREGFRLHLTLDPHLGWVAKVAPCTTG